MLKLLLRASIFFINLFFEIRYKVKRYFFQYTHPLDCEIDDIYLINCKTNRIIDVDSSYKNELNHMLKYSGLIILNNIIPKSILNSLDEYLLEIEYRKHSKAYRVNFQLISEKPLLFPIYKSIDMKKRNMNKITDIDGDEKILNLLSYYGGPLNDFYLSKDLGIPLMNIFDRESCSFPFRDRPYKLGDIFLNEYNVGKDGEIGEDKVFVFKNSLDNTKLENSKTEQYILSNYKTLDVKIFSWKNIKSYFVKEKVA